MDESIIIKVIRGEATQEENKVVLEWIKESPENLKKFSQQKMLWTLSSLPNENAPFQELALFNEIVKNRKNTPIEKKINEELKWKRRTLVSMAAAVILLVALIGGIFNSNNGTKIVRSTNAITSLDSHINMRSLYTDTGVKGKVTLPDGSTVWLNSNSKITYPDVFSDHSRRVELSGEAFFEVASDSLRPMIVSTGKGFSIEVLGTKFSLRSYENDSDSRAILYNGSIKLITNKGTNSESSLKMVPNDCAIIMESGIAILSKIVEPNKDAWMKGELIFEDTPMKEVLKVLERWYGKQFDIKDNTFYDYKLNASFKSESLIQVLEIINLCTSSQYKITDDTVTFSK